jgi:hypothetical protein
MQNNKEEKKKILVITNQELVFIFVVFLSILFVLHPKDLIKKQILRENSNYDLSMLYLKNILEQEPDNEEVMLLLAQQSLRSGKKDLSVKLLGLLLKSKDKKIRTRVTFLSYDLLKDDYHFLKNEEKKRKLKKRLKALMKQIIKDNVYKEKDLEKWYDEAIFLDDDEAKYVFVKKLLAKDERNLRYLKDAYYLSVKLGFKNDTTDYIHSLAQYDLKNQASWQRDEYYTLIHNKQYKRAEVLLQAYSETSLQWKKTLAEFYTMRRSYKKAAKIYELLFNMTDDYTQKKKYFMKMVQTLQAGNYLGEAAKLGRSYESYYAKDRDVRNFLLKLYMATGYLDYALTLSKQILEQEMKK